MAASRMRKEVWIILLLCAATASITFMSRPVEAAEAGSNYNEAIVVLNDDPGESDRIIKRTASRGMAERHKQLIEFLRAQAEIKQAPLRGILDSLVAAGSVRRYLPLFVVNAILVEAEDDALRQLADLPGVAGVERAALITLILDEPAADTLYHHERTTAGGLVRIRATDVWAMGITGAGILVSHMDSGVNGTHPALAGRWRGSYGYPAAACWLDLAGSTSAPTDTYGHGTQTMSIILGAAPGDTVGVAWGARYISSRLNFSNGTTTVTTALTALNWLIDPDGNPATFDDVPRVLSNSWGLDPTVFGACNTVLNAALDNCEAAGIAVFWAAGNEGEFGAQTIRVPADRAVSETSSFAVGAFDHLVDSLYYRSSRGPSQCSTDPNLRIKPELVAPGRNVRAASLGSSYATNSGTSYSVAHAAGVAALMLEANPELSADSLRRLLLMTAADKGSPGNDNAYGYGQVDALFAVLGALGGVGWVDGAVTDVYGFEVPAVISLQGHPHTSLTDGMGNFTMPLPAQTPITLVVSAPPHSVFTQSVVVMPRETLRVDFVLTLAPNNGVLQGVVTDCRGYAAAGATVWVDDNDIPAVVADEDGRFHFFLAAGFYEVFANDGFCETGMVENVQILDRGITDIEIVLPINPDYLCSEPDGFSYRACDDNDPGGPAYEWREIAPARGGGGIVHNLGEDASIAVALPFPVTYYGVTYRRLHINSNGNVSFVRALLEYNNTTLPRNYTPAVFPFWDDLSDQLGGDICSVYDPARGLFIVEWAGVPRYDGNGDETFELIIRDAAAWPSAAGNTIFEAHYGELSRPDRCTVGIDAAAGGNFVQYVFNGSYDVHASPLTSGRAIRFQTGDAQPGAPQLTVLNPVLTLSLPPGTALDTVLIVRNDGDYPLAYSVTPAGLPAPWTYSWTRSTNPGGPPYEFFDIAGIGTPTGIVRDDTTSDPLPLPWHFPFYGRWFDGMAICSNGYVSFTSCMYDRSWFPYPLSDNRDPFYALAPWWIDLDPSRGGAIVTYHDSLRERFIVQWDQIRRYSGGGPNTFQTVLYRDGRIEFVYATMSGTLTSGCVGIKGRSGSERMQLAYNQTFLQSNLLVRMTRVDTARIAVIPRTAPQGVLAALEQRSIVLRVENRTLQNGSVTVPLVIQSSDPQAESLAITVNVEQFGDPALLNLTILAREDGIQLSWRRQSSPAYCIYGAPGMQENFTFITATTDTLAVLPAASQETYFYEVRMCDGPPSAAAAVTQDRFDLRRIQEQATKH